MWPRVLGSSERERERESGKKREMMKIKELFKGVESVKFPMTLYLLSSCHAYENKHMS